MSTFLVMMLLACGGGDPVESNPFVLDDLTSVKDALTTSQSTSLCGVSVGTHLLKGVVTGVHDGDTLTLSASGINHKIRLDSIDAPELAQFFGNQSQITLANAVLDKPVKVAYSKTDQYGRVIGAVFDEACQYINLNQVTAGMAWFYKAYQCEISEPVRTQFINAQNTAVADRIGLWSQNNPVAPWAYRNGNDPIAPVCFGDIAK